MLNILDLQLGVIYNTKNLWFAMIDRLEEAGSEEEERKFNDRFNDEVKYVELLQEGQTRMDDYKLRELRQPTEKTASLRHYVEDLQRICMQLENCHESTESAVIRVLIESKLPDSALTEIVKAKKASTTAAPWTTTTLRAKLQEVVDLRDEAERTNERLNERMKYDRDRAREDDEPPASAVFSNRKRETPKCFFCDCDHHVSADCVEIEEYDERFKKAMELSLCLKCLKKGQRKDECSSKAVCYVCQGKDHNAALCRMGKALGKSDAHVTVSVKAAPKEERIRNDWFSIG